MMPTEYPFSSVTALALDGAGNVVFGGTNQVNALAGRLTSAGVLDPSFNDGGALGDLPFAANSTGLSVTGVGLTSTVVSCSRLRAASTWSP